MAVRTPDLACPSLEALLQDNTLKPLQWHSIQCQLVTPLYGGGVESATVDERMPIRVSAIRGQLRIWWRLLAKHKWKLGSDVEIRRAEFALWGGMGKEAHASEVFLKVENVGEATVVPYKDYATKPNPNNPHLMMPTELAYVFFPASNETNPDVTHEVIKEGLTWDLHFRFANSLQQDAERVAQVVETLRWWGQFGGLGFRSRRGTGAVHALACEDYPEIATVPDAQEVTDAGCQLATLGASGSALEAWKKAITKLRDFRQAPNIGRNPSSNFPKPAGRSRWPEPDAIRRIQKRASPKHEPVHKAGNVFPRGLFGMPIIFHFVDAGEPKDMQLKPKGKDKERMPSPIIIRPIFAGQDKDKIKWQPAALLLPFEHLNEMNVELKDSSHEIALWKPSLAEHVRPIAEYNATHPLIAFMNYFKK